jgi:hypothetical protein
MKKSFLLVALFCLSACATVQLDLPGDAMPVSGANPRRWNAPISFGEWRTETVKEGSKRSFLIDYGLIDEARASQAYRLTINSIEVDCHASEIVVGAAGFFVDASLGQEPLLVCGYEREGKRSVLALSRTSQPEPSLRGELRQVGDGSLEVRSLHRAPGVSIASGDPFGFEITRSGKRVAMIETINRGRVWIDPQAPDRDTLAAAAASLLLFRDPDAGDV